MEEPNNNTSAALLEENRSLRRIIQEKDLRILELEKQLGFIQTQPQNPIEKITETIPDEESSKRDQLFGIIKEKLKVYPPLTWEISV